MGERVGANLVVHEVESMPFLSIPALGKLSSETAGAAPGSSGQNLTIVMPKKPFSISWIPKIAYC